MTSYAVGILTGVSVGPAIVEYLERIDATLADHSGRFVVHGAGNHVKEGSDVLRAATGDRLPDR